MFDLENFYDDARNNRTPDSEGLKEYINSFENIVVWGIGYLGTEVDELLRNLDIKPTVYWDMRTNELPQFNGLDVEKPLEREFDRINTVFIFCITNCFVQGVLKNKLKQKGYNNVVSGEHLYYAFGCMVKNATNFNIICRDAKACDGFTCEKNDILFRNNLPSIGDPELLIRNLTIVINQICTLKCKYCYSYTNAYPKEKRVNFPVERVLKDIDLFFDAVDGVKFIPLIGGETFLHPDLNAIVKKLLSKGNLGILNVTTNGIVKMKEETFDGFDNDRLQVVFSNYKVSLSPEQNDIYDRNIEFAKSLGVRVIASTTTPTWNRPTTLCHKPATIESMTKKRNSCFHNPLTCNYLKNGKFFPCSMLDSLYNLEVADYKDEYVELDTAKDSNELRRLIYAVRMKPYLKACAHCETSSNTTGELLNAAGEQGFWNCITGDYND